MASIDEPSIRNPNPLPPDELEGDRIQPGNPWFGIVWINNERMSGTPCFYGTRVPIKNLFDYLEGGESLDDFLVGFPGVTQEQAVRVLRYAQSALFAALHA